MIIAAARSSALGAGDRQLERMRRHHPDRLRTPRRRCLPAAPAAPGPAAPPRATRNASRTSVGIVPVPTIWCASLVSGFIAATMSTIWKRAWRDARMPFWPVIITIGIAPSVRVGRGGGEVQRARAERRDADAGLAGQPPVGRGHEAGRLLVARDHQLDARGAQRLDDVEVLLAGNAEDALDAFVLERGDEEIGAFGHEACPGVSGLHDAPTGRALPPSRRTRARHGRSDERQGPPGYPRPTMYTAFFGLQQEPFSIAPDPRFLYMSDKHREALLLLGYGLTRGASFVLLTGEIGAGKTTVWRRFLEELPSNYDVASVVNPKLDTDALLARVFEDLGVELPADGKSVDLIDALHGHLLLAHAQGRRTPDRDRRGAGTLERGARAAAPAHQPRFERPQAPGDADRPARAAADAAAAAARAAGAACRRPLPPALPFRERDRRLHRPPPGGGRTEGTDAVRRRVARPDPPALPRRAAADQRHLRPGDVERPGDRQPARRPACGRARGRAGVRREDQPGADVGRRALCARRRQPVGRGDRRRRRACRGRVAGAAPHAVDARRSRRPIRRRARLRAWQWRTTPPRLRSQWRRPR